MDLKVTAPALFLTLFWITLSPVHAEDLEEEELATESSPEQSEAVAIENSAPESTDITRSIANNPELADLLAGPPNRFGFGLQYLLENSATLLAQFERRVFGNVGVGVLMGALGETFTSNTTRQNWELLGTINLHSERGFRGFWLQAGGGIAYVHNPPTLDASLNQIPGDTFLIPTIVGTVGWSWGFMNLAGLDDGFSFSIVAGVQSFLGGVSSANAFSLTEGRVRPIVRAELNFGF